MESSSLFCPLAIVWGDVANWVQAVGTILVLAFTVYAIGAPRRQELQATRDRIRASANPAIVEIVANGRRLTRVLIATIGRPSGAVAGLADARVAMKCIRQPCLESITDHIQVLPERWHHALIAARWAVEADQNLVLSDTGPIDTLECCEAIGALALHSLLQLENAYRVLQPMTSNSSRLGAFADLLDLPDYLANRFAAAQKEALTPN